MALINLIFQLFQLHLQLHRYNSESKSYPLQNRQRFYTLILIVLFIQYIRLRGGGSFTFFGGGGGDGGLVAGIFDSGDTMFDDSVANCRDFLGTLI